MDHQLDQGIDTYLWDSSSDDISPKNSRCLTRLDNNPPALPFLLPPLPYVKGRVFDLHPIEPPSFPPAGKTILYHGDPLEQELLGSLESRLIAYRQNFSPKSPLGGPDVVIALEKSMRTGTASSSAQVLLASTVSASIEVDRTVVAKFYDPLYYHDPQMSSDPFKLAARSVINETSCYDWLRPLQGSLIPRYFGLFTTAIPEQERNAYVILLEYICGTPLNRINPSVLPHDANLFIMNAVRDGETSLVERGVFLHDFAPRNTIVRSCALKRSISTTTQYGCPAPSDGFHTFSTPVVFIDFEHVTLIEPQSSQFKAIQETLSRFAEEEGPSRFQSFTDADWILPDLSSWRKVVIRH